MLHATCPWRIKLLSVLQILGGPTSSAISARLSLWHPWAQPMTDKIRRGFQICFSCHNVENCNSTPLFWLPNWQIIFSYLIHVKFSFKTMPCKIFRDHQSQECRLWRQCPSWWSGIIFECSTELWMCYVGLRPGFAFIHFLWRTRGFHTSSCLLCTTLLGRGSTNWRSMRADFVFSYPLVVETIRLGRKSEPGNGHGLVARLRLSNLAGSR